MKKIVALYQSGLDLRAVAKALGISKSSVHRELVRLQIPRRLRGGQNPVVGQKKKDSHGYVIVYRPNHPNRNANGYVFEHRLVMERHLDRILEQNELVHHINEVVEDNRIENLTVTDRSCHSSHHAKINYHKRKIDDKGRFSSR